MFIFFNEFLTEFKVLMGTELMSPFFGFAPPANVNIFFHFLM